MRLLMAILISHAAMDVVRAGVTFLGPTPYLSKADSPFPVDGSNPNFYLEDFEDGKLNTPGIFQPLHSITHATAIGPSGLTDSVDSDDGLIDGSGNAGHSLASNAFILIPIDPPFAWSFIRFGFDDAELGFYPNAFGFAWTDSLPPNKLLIELFDSEWNLMSAKQFEGLGDEMLTGETAEDRFLGVVSSTPFAFVQLTSMYPGSPYTFEIDHVQYGILVPEPSSALSLLCCIFASVLTKRARLRPLCAATLLMAGLHCNSALAAPGDLLFKLTAPDPQPGAAFGKVLTTVDGNVLVGEPGRFNPSIDAPGRAYLFDAKSGGLKVTFNNPELTQLDVFAGALAGGDGRVFISASGLTNRVYAFGTVTGELLYSIHDPDTGSNNFGLGLDYGNGRLLVSSAYPSTVNLLGAGRAYLFDPAIGQLQLTLPNPEPNAGDGFGSGKSLSLFGNRIAVGGIGDNSFAGRVWVFDRDSGNVIYALENPNPDSVIFDWFGWAVAANDDVIVVGAREDGTSGVPGSGTVYVFNSDTGDLLHTLYSPQPESNGEFGRSVGLTPQGDVLVGAWGTSVNGIEGAGHMYLFDDTTGNLLLDIPNPEPSEFAAFGWSVAAVDGRLVVGSLSGTVDEFASTGSVYVFATVPEPNTASIACALIIIFEFIHLYRRSLGWWFRGPKLRR